MFVVAIVSSFYDDDAGKHRDVIGDHLFETTAAAKAYIAQMIFEDKKERFLNRRRYEIHDSYNRQFRSLNEEPPLHETQQSKPVFVHERAIGPTGKEYQKAHAALVEEWKRDVLLPVQDRWNVWNSEKIAFSDSHTEADMNDIRRFADTSLRIEIEAMDSYFGSPNFSDVKFSTKVLEVFK
jgi:hypothetical protein